MENLICWFSSITGEDVKNVLVSIPGVFLAGFSLYFACQKTGNKILVSYSIENGRTVEERIATLELINEKNKPVSIFSIHAVLNKDVVIELISFDVPIILKPLESIQITTPRFSAMYLGDERYKPDLMKPNKVTIYVISHKKKIRCTTINPPSINAMYDFELYRKATKSVKTFNGKVYNENVKYAITYCINSKENTAFIENWGFITDGWGFKYNRIPQEYLSSKELVTEYLTLVGYDKFFEAMVVDDLE